MAYHGSKSHRKTADGFSLFTDELHKKKASICLATGINIPILSKCTVNLITFCCCNHPISDTPRYVWPPSIRWLLAPLIQGIPLAPHQPQGSDSLNWMGIGQNPGASWPNWLMVVHPVVFHRFWQIPETRGAKIWTLLMALDIPHLHKSGKLTDHKPKITHVESQKTRINENSWKPQVTSCKLNPKSCLSFSVPCIHLALPQRV